MNVLMTVTTFVALLGSALIAGVFFAFSSFIMKALANRPSPEGIAAMQSINVVVLNRSFLGVFIGTALVSALILVLSVMGWETQLGPWHVAGALLYIVGTFLVTARGNVPLNNRLASVSAAEPDALAVWEHYLDRWTMLNSVRTVAALAAVLMFTIALVQSAGS